MDPPTSNQPSSPSSPSAPPPSSDPLADIPDLQTYPATTEPDRVAALKLIADSIAQQRQLANSSLIFSPLNLTITVGVLAVVSRFMYTIDYDPALIAITCVGVLMTLLLVCRILTQEYLGEAEKINFAWLDEGEKEGEMEVLVTRFGDEVIGTVVVVWKSGSRGRSDSGGSGQGKKKGRNGRVGIVRAWTVRMRYRGKGVGSALLEDVVKEGRKRGVESVEFDAEHAHAKRFLPSVYNGIFDQQEHKAYTLLQDLNSSSGRGKRK